MSDAVWLAVIVAVSGGFTAWLNYKLNAKTTGKVEQVHELVNSGATKQITDTYDATKAQLVTLDQLLALQTSTGKTVSKDATATREALSNKVIKLEAELAERAKQTEIAASKLV
jgi:hypothetical protein